MWKEKLGNYLIDISKYIFTGVVIASLFKDMGDNKWLIYPVQRHGRQQMANLWIRLHICITGITIRANTY